MNILLDRLPDSVLIAGVEFVINTDFRVSILFEQMMQDNSLDDAEKADGALHLYFPVIPSDINEALDAVTWFYAGAEEKKTGTGKQRGRIERIYDFEFDADYIYAALLQQYRIDLQDVRHLHWWKFKAMLKALTEACEFRRIMGYRAADTSKMGKEQAQFYREMKELYRIPLGKNEQEKQDALIEALKSGGDLTGLI